MKSVIILTILAFSIAIQAAPTAVIKIDAVSTTEIEELALTTETSSGLPVVGTGELVYLIGAEAAGEIPDAYAWSFDSTPAGSQAVFSDATTGSTTFRPDLIGEFVVKLAITTPTGTAETTVKILSGHYVGVGNVGGATPQLPLGQCGAFCHNSIVSKWQATGHASMFTEAIDGIKSSHYGKNCISCHTVGYDTDTLAVNGGFDDVATALGWTFPTVLQAGNWDTLVTHFNPLAQVSNIQCENCHGPGSLHKANKEKIAVSLDEGMCGKCHDDAPYHIKSAQWKTSLHAIGVPEEAERTDCAGCHSGYGFIHRMDPTNRLDETLGAPQTSCAVCHDPHDATVENQLRSVADVILKNNVVITTGGKGKLCMNCHMSRRDGEAYAPVYHSRHDPHNSQADMLAGTNAATFGLHIPSSNHRNVIANSCVTCHMAPTPAAGQPGNNKVGEHTFNIKSDNGTPDDPSDDVYNLTLCRTCHGNVNSLADFKARMDYDGDTVIESAQDELEGLLDEVGNLLPPSGPEVKVTKDYTTVQLQAAYNWAFVEEDKSMGIHNYNYAIGLLQASHAALTTGSLGAGSIASISDVPNDQGKQVRVVWSRFGGDGVGSNPIQQYAVWRRVDDQVPGLGKVAAVKSLGNVPTEVQTLSSGTKVQLDGVLWDLVGSVPALGQDKYSIVVPTLFDSTKTDGIHWSVFYVTGHTANTSLFAASAPDSGYSVDNLEPAAPMGLAASEKENGVELTWKESADKDYKYFALYRSETAGFDPTGTEPIAQLTTTLYLDTQVNSGKSFYYRLSVVDFGGNESNFSPEVAVVVTSTGKDIASAVPKDFVMDQNYPNPFNPSTKIQFGLPVNSDVRLSIYNLNGALVRSLFNGRFAAGYHTVTWDGRDENGQVVGAGAYLYRLETSSMNATRKMIFIK
jgi:hypothetical protein